MVIKATTEKILQKQKELHVHIITNKISYCQETNSTKSLRRWLRPQDMILYSNTPPHTKVLWARSVDETQTLLIPGAEYSTLNEVWLRFEPVTTCHSGF